MKIIKIFITSCLFVSCLTTSKLGGTYTSVCVVYDTMPNVVLSLKNDNTFSYKLPYIEDKIEGSWEIKSDSLILKSDYFLKESPPDTPIRKNTDLLNGVDIYIIKGKKLFPLMKAGVDRTCYLTRAAS